MEEKEKNQFDLNEIINDIEYIEKDNNFCKKIEIFLIRIKKKKNEIYKQESSDKSKKLLFKSLKYELNQPSFKNREIVDYDIVMKKKNMHELVKISDFDNIGEELKKFDDGDEFMTSTRGLIEKDFDIYMVSITTKSNNYKIFGSFSGIFKLQKKYLFGVVPKGNFEDSKINFSDSDNIVGFNRKIDLLVVNNQFLLINQAQSKFDNLFQMNDYFSGEAIKRLNNIEKLKTLLTDSNSKQLAKKMKERKTMARKFIKITNDRNRFDETINRIGEYINNGEDDFLRIKIPDVTYKNHKLIAEKGKESELLDALADFSYTANVSKVQSKDESRT